MRHVWNILLPFTVAVRNYFLAEGQHFTNLLQKSNISIHTFLVLIFVLCGNGFIKEISSAPRRA